MGEPGVQVERQCGNCRVCCVVFELDDPDAGKSAGEPCRHLCSQGCAIYDHRPQVCRAWHCVWRLMPELPDHWRPDLSGILIYQIKNEIPGYHDAGLILSLSNGFAHLEDEALLGFILLAVKNRQPIYLGVHKKKEGAVERADSKALLLNPGLERAVAADDRAGFVAILKQAIGQKLSL
jgi:hypothetical protein